jgi:type 1 glutamine amidotransferase
LVVSAFGAPSAPAASRQHIFVYSGTAGFRHISIGHAKEVLAHVLDLSGRYSVEFSENPADLTPKLLARTDIVLWLNSTGAASPFNKAQQAAYISWLKCGGGHVGVHASADSYKDWPHWAEVTGAFFASHPITATSAADDQTPQWEGWGEPEATLLVLDRKHPATRPWARTKSFNMRDEYYRWDGDPADKLKKFRPLLALERFNDPVVAQMFGGDYAPRQPLAWAASFRGLNRVFYTNLGHSVITWDRPDFQRHVLGGIDWVAAKGPSATCLRRASVR